MNAAATASESNRVVLPCFPFHPHQPTFSSRVQETASIDIDPSPSISTRSYRNTARVTTEYLFAKHTYIYIHLLFAIRPWKFPPPSSTNLTPNLGLLPREQRMD